MSMSGEMTESVSKVTVEIPVNGSSVFASLDLPVNVDQKYKTTGVILAHGAGGTKDSGFLPTFAAAFAAAGFPCLRFSHKSPSVAMRAAFLSAVMNGAKKVPQLGGIERWVCAGHSMGGRVACQVAAEQPLLVPACLLFSYPLHPPNKPGVLRDKPLTELALPILFVRGTRDPFSTQQRFDEVLARMASPCVKVHVVDGGDHGLVVRGKGGAPATQAAIRDVCAAVIDFLDSVLSHNLFAANPGQPCVGASHERITEVEAATSGMGSGVSSGEGSRATDRGGGGKKVGVTRMNDVACMGKAGEEDGCEASGMKLKRTRAGTNHSFPSKRRRNS